MCKEVLVHRKRRYLIFVVFCVVFSINSLGFADDNRPHFACGVRTGEVDQTSAIVWVRLTKEKEARYSKLAIFTEGLKPKDRSSEDMPIDVVPGVKGLVQVKHWIEGDLSNARSSEWFQVLPKNDFIHQFQLSQLIPGKRYEYEVSAKLEADSKDANTIKGSFKTAPDKDEGSEVRFIVSTCQAIRSIDSGKEGHRAYQQMLDIDPDFFIHTGDFLYYDKTPFAKNVAAANAKWNLMFSYGHSRNFLKSVGSYFIKDDHDTLKNDCWPGQKYGDLTFDQGLKIFRQQVCMGKDTYRTIRWGKDLQIWMTENRDFRSPNRKPDGPDKTILGEQQKKWLMKSVHLSDATFRFIVTPGPIVGPDKKGKNDNHSNPGFTHEGQELRDFISKQENTYVICGDRHWQYCSKDPKTGVLEFGCGPINDEHNFGGTSGRNRKFHRYFGPKGGFLLISVKGDKATAEWFHANDPNWVAGQPPKKLHVEQLPIGK